MDRRLPEKASSVPQMIEGFHLTEDALEVYSLGRLLAEEDLSILEEHLLVCSYCQTRLHKIDQFVQAASDGAKAFAEASIKKKSRRLLTLSIAAAVAFLGVIPLALQRIAAPVEVVLVAMRDEKGFSVSAGKALQIKPDCTGLHADSLVWELASIEGKLLRSGIIASSGTIATAQLSSGQYWLRLRDFDSSELLREFSLEAR